MTIGGKPKQTPHTSQDLQPLNPAPQKQLTLKAAAPPLRRAEARRRADNALAEALGAVRVGTDGPTSPKIIDDRAGLSSQNKSNSQVLDISTTSSDPHLLELGSSLSPRRLAVDRGVPLHTRSLVMARHISTIHDSGIDVPSMVDDDDMTRAQTWHGNAVRQPSTSYGGMAVRPREESYGGMAVRPRSLSLVSPSPIELRNGGRRGSLVSASPTLRQIGVTQALSMGGGAPVEMEDSVVADGATAFRNAFRRHVSAFEAAFFERKVSLSVRQTSRRRSGRMGRMVGTPSPLSGIHDLALDETRKLDSAARRRDSVPRDSVLGTPSLHRDSLVAHTSAVAMALCIGRSGGTAEGRGQSPDETVGPSRDILQHISYSILFVATGGPSRNVLHHISYGTRWSKSKYLATC